MKPRQAAFPSASGRSAKFDYTTWVRISAMSVPCELSPPSAGWERIQELLGELRSGQEESEHFFDGAFDQLDSLCAQLLACPAPHAADAPAPVAEDPRWKELLETAGRDQAELQSVRDDVIAILRDEGFFDSRGNGDSWDSDSAGDSDED